VRRTSPPKHKSTMEVKDNIKWLEAAIIACARQDMRLNLLVS